MRIVPILLFRLLVDTCIYIFPKEHHASEFTSYYSCNNVISACEMMYLLYVTIFLKSVIKSIWYSSTSHGSKLHVKLVCYSPLTILNFTLSCLFHMYCKIPKLACLKLPQRSLPASILKRVQNTNLQKNHKKCLTRNLTQIQIFQTQNINICSKHIYNYLIFNMCNGKTMYKYHVNNVYYVNKLTGFKYFLFVASLLNVCIVTGFVCLFILDIAKPANKVTMLTQIMTMRWLCLKLDVCLIVSISMYKMQCKKHDMINVYLICKKSQVKLMHEIPFRYLIYKNTEHYIASINVIFNQQNHKFPNLNINYHVHNNIMSRSNTFLCVQIKIQTTSKHCDNIHT